MTEYNFTTAEIFKVFNTLQKKGVNIIFGDTKAYDDVYGPYITYAAKTIPRNLTQECLEDGIITLDDIPKICDEQARVFLNTWVESINPAEPLVLRNLPTYLVEDDFVRGCKVVLFRVRQINKGCTFPQKEEGSPTISML